MAKEIRHIEFLKRHLNVSWLRPESALWDAVASTKLSKYKIIAPSLDLGCGNGIFSFITAGGNFSIDYDWFINADPQGFWENKDIYNECKIDNLERYIIEQPGHSFTFGLDYKPNLLKQANALHFYENLTEHDANIKLPYQNETFKTVFSNILYWLNDPKRSLREIHRILDKEGVAILCVPNKKFLDYCLTYNWKKKGSVLLQLLNRGRSESIKWAYSCRDFSIIAKGSGFKILGHSYYLSPLMVKMWDIGLRPLSPLLIKMANKLSPSDRRAIKSEWLETIIKFLSAFYEIEENSRIEGGFHLFVLAK